MPPEVTTGITGLLAGEDQVMELGPIYYKGYLSKSKKSIIKVTPFIFIMEIVRRHL